MAGERYGPINISAILSSFPMTRVKLTEEYSRGDAGMTLTQLIAKWTIQEFGDRNHMLTGLPFALYIAHQGVHAYLDLAEMSRHVNEQLEFSQVHCCFSLYGVMPSSGKLHLY
jgi:hypothetical protein